MKEKIIVDTAQKKSVISPEIYGHFSEHLGRCIYGGLWVGKDSPIANKNGCRKDVVEAFKKIKIPSLRWPGGCFADEYHWKDGIGLKENRKRMINTNWGGVVEDNSFGTHEFMELCDQLGCKPYVNGNVGSGTVQEMDEWIEYMTFNGESPMANLRAKNGHKDAWQLPYFAVGNENWGCGGNMKSDYYANQFRRYQTFVRQYGKDKIYKVACGPNSGDYGWTDTLMREAAPFMDGLSLHYYTVPTPWDAKKIACDFNETEWYKTMKTALYIEDLVRRHSEIMDKYDDKKRVGLIVDEWGTWFAVEPGTNPGFLYQQNTIRDALVAGLTLNVFNNHSDRVKGANIAQAVNVLQSPILTEGDKMVLTPTYHIFDMYKEHQGGTLVQTTIASSAVGKEDNYVSSLNASASVKDEDGKAKYTVTVCNTDYTTSHSVEISFAGLSAISKVEAQVVTSNDTHDCNTFEKPDTVTIHSLATKTIEKDTLAVELPAHSVVAITVHS